MAFGAIVSVQPNVSWKGKIFSPEKFTVWGTGSLMQ